MQGGPPRQASRTLGEQQAGSRRRVRPPAPATGAPRASEPRRVAVATDGAGHPRWLWPGRDGRRAVAEVLEVWPDVGAWWDGEPEKVFYRVLLAGGTVCEIYRDPAGAWYLYRVYD